MSLGFSFIQSCSLADDIHSSPSIIPVASVSLLHSFPAMFGFIALIIHFVPPHPRQKSPSVPFSLVRMCRKSRKCAKKAPLCRQMMEGERGRRIPRRKRGTESNFPIAFSTFCSAASFNREECKVPRNSSGIFSHEQGKEEFFALKQRKYFMCTARMIEAREPKRGHLKRNF